MTIAAIDEAACNGCGICVKHCPIDVIRLDRERKKAVVAYREDMQLYDAEIGKNAAAAMAKSCVVGKGGGLYIVI